MGQSISSCSERLQFWLFDEPTKHNRTEVTLRAEGEERESPTTLSATATELGGCLLASARAAAGKEAEAAAAPPETAREGTDAIGGRGVRRERRREHQPRRGREEDSMSSCGGRRGVDEGDNTDKGWFAQVLEGNRAAMGVFRWGNVGEKSHIGHCNVL